MYHNIYNIDYDGDDAPKFLTTDYYLPKVMIITGKMKSLMYGLFQNSNLG
jgi:hypothetical protein